MSALTLNVNLLSDVMAQEYDKYGDNYRQYPTDNKKYECRTGPFEGFFVGSVEFCKFKFIDKVDNRDNSTGTQGPPGPQGPGHGATGATGPQGPPGATGPQSPNQINSTSIYTVQGNLSLVTKSSPGSASAPARCDPGDDCFKWKLLAVGFNRTTSIQRQ